MKRFFTAMLTIALTVALSTFALAANEEKQASREAMREQRQLVQQGREALCAQTDENKALKADCKLLRAEQKAAGTQTAEQKQGLLQIKQAIAQEKAVLTQSKGKTKALTLAAKEQRKAGEFDAAAALLEQAAALIAERQEAKQEISELLAEKKTLLT